MFRRRTAYEISGCLVGSEMCMRGRVGSAEDFESFPTIDYVAGAGAVSYIHLTLPTISSVHSSVAAVHLKKPTNISLSLHFLASTNTNTELNTSRPDTS